MDTNSEMFYRDKQEPIPRKDTRASFVVRIVFLIVLIVIIIITASIAVLRNQRYQFSEVSVFGATTFSSEEIVQFTQEYWSGHYLKTIPKTSTILFSKDDFQKKLHERFPVIEMVYVTLPAPDVLEIYIKERIPVIVWCFQDQSCGFVDEHGILYARAPQFSEGVYPIFESESTQNFSEQIAKVVLDPQVMNRFIKLFETLQSDNITLTRTYFNQNGDIAFSIDILFGLYVKNGAKLLGKINQDDSLFVRDLNIGLSNDVFKKQYLANPKDLEYIDMRFPGKIFYKFTTSEKSFEQQADPSFE